MLGDDLLWSWVRGDVVRFCEERNLVSAFGLLGLGAGEDMEWQWLKEVNYGWQLHNKVAKQAENLVADSLGAGDIEEAIELKKHLLSYWYIVKPLDWGQHKAKYRNCQTKTNVESDPI